MPGMKGSATKCSTGIAEPVFDDLADDDSGDPDLFKSY
jgi:hypothetical protein